MKDKLIKFLQENFFALIIVLITIVLAWQNYTPGTWLTGWDTLHPEFNFPLNFQRLFYGVWREDQGLGAVAAHSHMSELPRVIILWILSFIFPIFTLRYLYIFLCLILGPLGVYFFLEKVVLKNKSFSFLGGLFYLLNLGTLQHFYIPFEMFTTQYAALGWLFLYATRYLENKSKKDLLLFSLVTFLALPQAYAATLFYAYLLVFIIYLLAFSIPKIYSKDFSFLSRPIILLFLTFLINAFWILPNLYFVKNYGEKVTEAKVNQLFTQEVFLKNKKYGTLEDTAILKGFLFDWEKTSEKGDKIVPLFDKWNNYYNKHPYILAIGFIAFAIILWGILNSFIKGYTYGLFLVPVFFIPYFVMTGMNSFALFYDWILKTFPILEESIRMPFTKFSLLLMFAFSFYFALGNLSIYELLKKRLPKLYLFQALLWSILLILYMLPAFKGELIGPFLRLKIPQEYFSAFNWINKQPNLGRIATFPSSSYVGWEIYRWGYQGAGFFWFGEKMPFLARDFDRWIPYNENYYHQISYAVYSKNKELFEKLLEKYQITHIVIDDSVLSRATFRDYLYLSGLKEMIEKMRSVRLAATFGKLTIYEVTTSASPKDYVFIAGNLPTIGSAYQWNNYDKAFIENGYYISGDITKGNENGSVYYPFRSLFTGKKQDEFEFVLEDPDGYFSFISKISKELVGATLYIPRINNYDVTEINSNDLSESEPKYPQIFLDGELVQYDPTSENGNFITLPYIKEGKLEIRVPKVNGYYSYDSLTDNLKDKVQPNCDEFAKGGTQSEMIEENGKTILRMKAQEATNCLDVVLTRLSQKTGYLATVESTNIEGKSTFLSVVNKNSDKSEIELYLPESKDLSRSYYVIPPMEEFGLGYSLFFKNTSIGYDESVNDLGRITVNPIPYRFLTSLKIVKDSSFSSTSEESWPRKLGLPPSEVSYRVDHPNPSFYQVSFDSSTIGGVHSATPEVSLGRTDNLYLVLSQSFDSGWKAYQVKPDSILLDSWYMKLLIPLFAKKLDNHVLVNNWENGWEISQELVENSQNSQKLVKTSSNKFQPVTTTIVLIYLPQYLEYLGFGLLGISTLYLLLKSG